MSERRDDRADERGAERGGEQGSGRGSERGSERGSGERGGERGSDRRTDREAAYFAQGPERETPGPSVDRPRPWSSTGVVGRPIPRVDGYERVSGSAVYPSDVLLPDMLYGAILRSPHPHARVKRIDASRAAAMPGVRAVLTQDSPEAQVEWSYSNRKTPLFDPHCRFEGDAVAAVAAEDPHQAWDAARAIEVEYEVLPFVHDERHALDDDAPKVHDDGNTVGEGSSERGDLEQGFAEADAIVEMSFRTEAELHTPLELHGCVARWERDRLTIWESTQGVYAVQETVAEVLGLPLSKVRVIGHYMGGGFGAKLQPGKYTIIAALLARKAARPVKLFLTREETYLCVGNRPPANMTVRIGAKKDGTLTAIDFTGLGTGGAWPAGGTSLLDWLARDLYTCPNVRTKTTDVFIHAGPARPFRAPGHPQGSWALEQAMDALAEKLGMDPVELRLRNIPEVSQARRGSPPFTTTGLRQCIEDGAKSFGWAEARAAIGGSWNGSGAAGSGGARDGTRNGTLDGARDGAQVGAPILRGVGMAACEWIAGGGGPPSTVIVRIFSDGSVNLNMGASDIGTGTKTVMAMVVAEELGVAPDQIQIENADTGTTQFATPSGGSKTVPTESPAVRDAALDARRQLFEMASSQLGIPADELRLRDGAIASTKDESKTVRLAELEGLQRRGVVVGTGYRGPNPEGKVVSPFAAQFCEVEVDAATGEVRIVRFLGAHDSGRVLNRKTYDNQVFGGITMGIGFAMTEQRILDRNTGKLANRNWHDYKLPTALDVPADMTCLPIDLNDTEANTTGAKGLGEPVTIPTAPAIANAVYHATGIRVTETPISPIRLAQALAERTQGVSPPRGGSGR